MVCRAAGSDQGERVPVKGEVELVRRRVRARGGLEWARAHAVGCPWDEGTCKYAVQGGHLELLVWAQQHHCPWNWHRCSMAAERGYLAVLQRAWEHGCPWTDDTCAAAAQFGHLATLQWLRAHDCPWGTMTCSCATLGLAHVCVGVGAGARLPVR